MSGLSRVSHEPSPDCARRTDMSGSPVIAGWVRRVPQLALASGMNIKPGIVLSALFGACFGLISAANAQTFGSSYTSTAPKDCRVTSAGTEVDATTIRICPGKAGLVV